MPNWVNNYIVIKGDAKELDAFEKHIKEPSVFVEKDTAFTFHSFVTLSPEKLDEYHEKHGSGPDGPYGNTEYNWYNWNCSNWNTKWDACHAEVDVSVDEIVIRFDTAWAPPEPVFVEIAKQFPQLEMEIEWEEEQGYGAYLASPAGDPTLTTTKEWNAPEDHADHVEQGKEDSCLCAHYDNPEDWYDDCPKEQNQVYEVEVVTTYKIKAYSKESAALAAEAEEQGNELPKGTELVSAEYEPVLRVSDPVTLEETE